MRKNIDLPVSLLLDYSDYNSGYNLRQNTAAQLQSAAVSFCPKKVVCKILVCITKASSEGSNMRKYVDLQVFSLGIHRVYTGLDKQNFSA